MYPGTIFNWIDNSHIRTEEDIVESTRRPLFALVSSFDKGPEKLMEIAGQRFYDLFGTMSFENHGQAVLQARRIINAGGAFLVKRVTAPDSTLANVIFTATVTQSTVQKTDNTGAPLYLDDDGNETTTVTSNPINIGTATIKWSASSISGCKTYKEVREAALKTLDEANGVYPLFVICDNGKGESSKSIRIVPDYYSSKSIGKTFYDIHVYEGTTRLENYVATLDPDVVYADVAYRFDSNTLDQCQGEVIESVYEAYLTKIADILEKDKSEVRNHDLVFGYSYKGEEVEGLSVDAESIDLNATYGIELKEGSNGSFGKSPVGTEAWINAICAVYDGEVTEEIWDVDSHKVFAVLDANYPKEIKESIAKWVNFRKDCFFFRDLGLGLTNFMMIKSAYNDQDTNSRFIANFSTSYEVKDPITKKNIEVTCLYDMAECLTKAYITSGGPWNPTAGFINGYVLTEAIKGTISYTPIITPNVNQKQAMEDIRVNYAVFNEDDCIMQATYTCNGEYTQLSYINNVLSMQEIARKVRTACPRNRYKLVTGTDFSVYSDAVNNVLSDFSSMFEVLKLVYTSNNIKEKQKIYYAAIEFGFKEWAQTEIFDLIATNNY